MFALTGGNTALSIHIKRSQVGPITTLVITTLLVYNKHHHVLLQCPMANTGFA